MTPVYCGDDVVMLEHIVKVTRVEGGYRLYLSDCSTLLVDTVGPLEKALDGRKKEGWLWRQQETS